MTRLTKDEYNWKVYTQEYSRQIAEMEKTAGDNGGEFLVTDFKKSGDKIIFTNRLHGNWKELYTTIHRTSPSSVFECGCGGMYHLKNIRTLFPNVKIGGCDLLQSQIDFGAEKFGVEKAILHNVWTMSFADPAATTNLGRYDFVYSHAVMLHLSYENTKVFMKNMTKIANQHIFFVEGEKHPYEEVLSDIGEQDKWDISHPGDFIRNAWLLTRR